MIRTVRALSRIRSTSGLQIRPSRQISRLFPIYCASTGNGRSSWPATISIRESSQKVHTPPEESLMDLKLYDNVCTETLEELNDYFEEILENTNCLDSAPDVLYSDGVLTAKISDNHGTYVINRQTPNRQIWLSSPLSGPKRFDYVPMAEDVNVGKWVYKHSGQVLHELLQEELNPVITDVGLDFLQLIHSGKVQ